MAPFRVCIQEHTPACFHVRCHNSVILSVRLLSETSPAHKTTTTLSGQTYKTLYVWT